MYGQIADISTKIIGLSKEDVDKYIGNMMKQYDKILNDMLKEIKLLERTKAKLASELEEAKKQEIVYVDEPIYEADTLSQFVDVAYERVDQTIALIDEIASQKIKQMAEQASVQLMEYDAQLESLKKQIDDNRENIDNLLGEVITLLKTNIDEPFLKKPDDTYETDDNENVISFSEAKKIVSKELKMVSKDVETTVIKNLEAYHNLKGEFVKYLDNILNYSGKAAPSGAVLVLQINEFVIANYFLESSNGDILIDNILNKIKDINSNLHAERLSYDQIGIIYNGISDVDNISKIAKIILRYVQKNIVINDNKVELSANMGIALYPQNSGIADVLINYAGIALFKSKQEGSGTFKFIDNELISDVKFDNDLKRDLIKAIEGNELDLYYQPQYSTENNEIMGFESLLRWKNAKYNKISILDIIRTAEKENLIEDIGWQVLEKACNFAKKVEAKSSRNIIISINFSPMQIVKEDFVEKVKSIIKETGVSPSFLGFEITETCFIENFEQTCVKIQEIKNMGIAILIDDFGTGYSSLSYLLKLPVSMVKIDKTFLSDLMTNPQTEMFLASIIDISHNLGLKVVAEGIETEKQHQMLKNMKCDYLQGYFLAKPVPESDAYMYV